MLNSGFKASIDKKMTYNKFQKQILNSLLDSRFIHKRLFYSNEFMNLRFHSGKLSVTYGNDNFNGNPDAERRGILFD